MYFCILSAVGGVIRGVCMRWCMCVCVFASTEKQIELSVFALHCGELSIVTGAESGLLLPHLKGVGGAFEKQ